MIRKKEIGMDTAIFLNLVTPWFKNKQGALEPDIKTAIEFITCVCNPYILFKICLILSIAYDNDARRQAHKRLLFYLVRIGNIGPKRIQIAAFFLKEFLNLPDYILRAA